MSESQAIEELRELAQSDDIEAAHSAADEILCQMLEDIGLGAVVEEWRKVPKWFA